MKNLIILFAFWSCGTANQNGTIEDTITVKVADHFDIRLPTVLGTGYSWSLKDSTYQQHLSFDTTYVITNPSGNEGARELQVFQFTGIIKGTTNLNFIHSRPWKKDEEPDKQKSYKVIVE